MRYLLVCLFAFAVLSSSFRFSFGQDLSGELRDSRLSVEDLARRIESKALLLEGLPRNHRWRDKLELELVKDRTILNRLDSGRTNFPADRKFKIIPSRESDSDVPIALSASDGPPLPFVLNAADLGKPVSNPFYAGILPGSDGLLLAVDGQRLIRRQVINNQPHEQLILNSEFGLIHAFAISPHFRKDGLIYLFCNPRSGKPPNFNRIISLNLELQDGQYIVSGVPRVLIEWESNGHDGGDLLFGNDGYLYIATGDGSQDSDQYLTAQNFSDLRGGVLRIDVSESSPEEPYRIPEDNPFVNIPDVRPELYAKGLRNPWRMSLDAKTGDIYLGNSGQDTTESVYLLEKGANYGWSRWEGSRIFQEKRPLGIGKLTFPLIDHDHSESRALTGGLVYRGNKFPELQGWYVYGDFETGKIWGARIVEGRVESRMELADTLRNILGFFQTADGELLVLSNTLYKLDRNTSVEGRDELDFPRLLSQTGLYDSTPEHQVVSSAVPYEVVASAWNNGANTERFFMLPPGQKAIVTDSGGWEYPQNSVVFQTLSLPVEWKGKTTLYRIETRILVKRERSSWSAYSYLWNRSQSDAYLVERHGITIDLVEHFGDQIRNEVVENWQVPSRTQCFACHTFHQNTLLGLNTLQLGSHAKFDDDGLQMMERWQKAGLTVDNRKSRKEPAHKLVDPYDKGASIQDRARSYLHANCGSCHVSVGGGNSKLTLSFTTPLESTGMVDALPEHSDFGIPNARIVQPGLPNQSVLLRRLQSDRVGKMPPMGRHIVDTQGVDLIKQWIQSLPKLQQNTKPWSTEELDSLLSQEPLSTSSRDLMNGRKIFQTAGCAQCHRIGPLGGGFGPDLTSHGATVGATEILKSIIEPSEKIAPNYRTYIFQLSSGEIIEGTRIDNNHDEYQILQKNSDGKMIRVPKSDVEEIKESDISSMPSGLLDRFSASDVADLLAFLKNPSP